MLNGNYRDTLNEYFNDDGSPKKCSNCKSTEFVETAKEYIEGVVCEYNVTCKNCNTDLGYWAYGGFSPEYARDYLNFGRNA